MLSQPILSALHTTMLTSPATPDWSRIDWVLFDMDGTLLDLHYDNHFWLEHLPRRYAEIHGLAEAEARRSVSARIDAQQGTLAWYCVDYWSAELGVDIAALKRETQDKIGVLPHALEFLQAVRASGRRSYLVTNAHHKSLSLKLERTPLASHLDGLLSSHSLGLPKEHPEFWPALRATLGFDPARTLFIDDSLAVLAAARHFGIGQLLAISHPDSQKPVRQISEYPALPNFASLLAIPELGA